MPMGKILEAFPGAQRALFQRYHIGGCSSCGFSPEDTLQKVCQNHNNVNPDEVIDHLKKSHEIDAQMQITPQETAERLKAGNGVNTIN